jgi:hypothetical protein
VVGIFEVPVPLVAAGMSGNQIGPVIDAEPVGEEFEGGAPGDRQRAKVKVLNRKRNSKPDWLRVMRSASRGARRSVDRGACRPAIEPRKYSNDQGADAVTLCGRQHGQARECECLFDSAWSKTLACRYALCTRTGRSPAWPPELLSERFASGRRGVEADDERAGEVRPLHSSYETGEQTWATGRGAGGAKEEDRGEHRRATHVPDSEPGKRVPEARLGYAELLVGFRR